MRFAYADPPYPGQAKRWYGDHPDYAGEVDHAELIERLCRDYPDGWALSTMATALQDVLALCPPVRIGIWHASSALHPGARADRWWNVWEPVIVSGGRCAQSEAAVVRDLCSAGRPARGFHGAKPEAFCRWVFELLGAQPGDELVDLFPGSGAVMDAWSRFDQPWFPETYRERKDFGSPAHRNRTLERLGQGRLHE